MVEVTLSVVLAIDPEVVPMTFAVIVQLELPASVAPDSDTTPPVAVAVPAGQVVAIPVGVAKPIPAGSVSETATPLSGVVFEFVMVRVMVAVEEATFSSTLLEKALVIAGGPATVRLATDVLPVPREAVFEPAGRRVVRALGVIRQWQNGLGKVRVVVPVLDPAVPHDDEVAHPAGGGRRLLGEAQ